MTIGAVKRRLRETARPVYGGRWEELKKRLKENYPDVPEGDIERSIDKYDQWKVRGIVLYNKSSSNALWEITLFCAGFLIILINIQHEFYGRVIAPLKAKKVEHAVAALELFISSLAWEENSHFSVDENKKDIVKFPEKRLD